MDEFQKWLDEMQGKYNPQEKLQSEFDDWYMQMAEKYQPKQPKKSFGRQLLDFPYTLASGMYEGFEGMVKGVKGLGSMVADTPVMDIVLSEEHKDKWKKAFDPAIQMLDERAGQMEAKGYQDKLPRAVWKGAGRMAAELPAIIGLAGAGQMGAATLPFVGATQGYDEGGWLGAALGAGTGAATHGIIGGLTKLPTNWRFPAGFATGAVTTPGDIEEKMAGGFLFGGLSAMGGGKKITPEEFWANYERQAKPLTKEDLVIVRQLEKGMLESDEALVKSMFSRPETKTLLKKKFPEILGIMGDALIDRNYSVNKFVKSVKDISNKTLAVEQDPSMELALFPGRYGIIEHARLKLQELVQPVRKLQAELEELGAAQRAIERAYRGIRNPPASRKIGAEIEYVDPSTGAMEHTGSATSVEALNRQKTINFWRYNTKTGKATPIIGTDAVDVPVSRMEVKFQVHTPTGKVTTLDVGQDAGMITTQQLSNAYRFGLKALEKIENLKPGIRSKEAIPTQTYAPKEIHQISVKGIEAQRAIVQLRQRVGDKTFKLLDNTMQEFYKWSDSEILQPLVEANVLSKKAYNSIKKNNEHWLPFEALKFLDSEALSSSQVGSEFFSVAGQNVIKPMVGASGKALPPFEGVMDRLSKTIHLAEKNKILVDFIKLRSMSPAIKKVIFPLKGSEAIRAPKDFEDIKVILNGKVTRWAVPKDVGLAFKHLTPKSADMFSMFLQSTSRLFRAGATSWYIPFTLGNAPRDFKMAVICNKYGFNPMDWTKGLWHGLRSSFGFESGLYKEYIKSKASFSGLMTQTKAYRVASENIFQPKGIQRAKEAGLFIRNLAEAVELAPRLGIYSKAIKKGVHPMEAALSSRRSTIDFMRSGHAMRVINSYVPFVNARAQAKVTLIERLADPKTRARASTKALLWAVLPSLSAYFYNILHHPELWDEVPPYIKDNYDIAILGEAVNEQGQKVPDYAKVTKGDVEQLLVNPIINFLEYTRGKDPGKLSEVALDWLSEASPIPFTREGKLSLSKAMASAVPPAMRAPVEVAGGKVLFTGKDIVPMSLQKLPPAEQMFEKTPGIYKKAGELTDTSPLKWQAFGRGMFGGVGYDPSLAGMARTISFRARGHTGGESLNKAYGIQKTAEQGYHSARRKIEAFIAEGKTTEAYRAKEEWNKTMIDVLVKMKKITGQNLTDLAATPFYRQYSFQESDWKRLMKGKDESWTTGLEKSLKHDFYR